MGTKLGTLIYKHCKLGIHKLNQLLISILLKSTEIQNQSNYYIIMVDSIFDKYKDFNDLPPDLQESFMNQVHADALRSKPTEKKHLHYDASASTIKELAKRGLTDDQIADCCGLSIENFEALISIDDLLESALKTGRAQGVSEVQGSLFRAAVRGNQDAIRFYLKNCSDLEDGPQGRKQKQKFKSDNFEEEMKKATERLFSE